MKIFKDKTEQTLDNELEARAKALVNSGPGSEEDLQSVQAFERLASVKRENEKAKAEERKGLIDSIGSIASKVGIALIGVGLSVWATKYQYDREFAPDPEIPRSQTSRANQQFVQSQIKKAL